ncbi:hypothetical protein BCR41DRAFT_361701 [Lobosporangium transversale]|uniref:Uncharacterized protein n=1 Tax=Lobosporangium transversale TaxID=64571 RepID=A0A1Y2GC56_9FUNG|nr:hypothetical protein BCR41DRAFT_361701 [Lobosporangium transversale]ORZ05506.1 hypothetical protein BCR41DRAFT_361701 [Lobosporangium transversale]|eukprot:XP_021877080.1 hypothetical protein BCR41DRAFT_361701 [Lobosporangium transversale]
MTLFRRGFLLVLKNLQPSCFFCGDFPVNSMICIGGVPGQSFIFRFYRDIPRQMEETPYFTHVSA